MTAPTDPAHAFEREALVFLPEVARFALSLTRDRDEADDLVQDTYLTAYRNWHQFTPGSECRAWLFTICRRRFYRLRERAEREEPLTDADLESVAAAAVRDAARASHLDTLFNRSDLGAAIRRAIDTLSPAFRDVVLLVDVEDHSYEAASGILGVPIGTVRSRLFRARRLLQEQLLNHARDAGFASASTPLTSRPLRSAAP